MAANQSTVTISRKACPLCSGAPSAYFATEHSHDLLRCGDCQTVFVHPQPGPEELRALYEERSRAAGESDYYRSYLRQERGLREHARDLLEMLGAPRGGARLLEVGCGAGFFLDEARKAGWKTRGIELNRVYARHAREELGIEVTGEDFEEVEVEGAPFDVVCMLDLLSHLRDPLRSLARVRELLVPGGCFFLQAGNKAENELKPDDEDWETPAHLFHFTARTLRGLLEQEGLRVKLEHVVPKVRVPKALASNRLHWLRELVRTALPLTRHAFRRFRAGRTVDDTVYLIARRSR